MNSMNNEHRRSIFAGTINYLEEVNEFSNYFFNGSYINLEASDLIKKSSSDSTNVREIANQMYAAKRHNIKDTHREILSLYSKCIALALNDSEQLALGYNNRSVLLKHLGKCKEAIIDIDRALKVTKSHDLEMKLLLRKMKCLELIENHDDQKCKKYLNSGNLQTAYDELNKMYTKFDKSLPKLPDWRCVYGNGKQLQLPEIISSENFPCVADSISLNYNEKFGQHMIATRDIKPGEIVAVEKGFVAIPNYHQQYLVCSHCCDFAWNGIPCDSCACIIYCSKKCKDEAWQEYHDIECLILPFFNKSENALSDDLTMTARFFLKFLKKEGLNKIINDFKAVIYSEGKNQVMPTVSEYVQYGEQLQSFRSFITFYKEFRKMDDDRVCSIIIDCLSKYTNIFNNVQCLNDSEACDDTKVYVKKVLLKLKCILNANRFGFKIKMNANCDCQNSNDCCRKIGTIFTPICSFFNHSCIFNTSRLYTNNGRMVLFTITPVKKGEQLFVCYGPDLFDDKETRKTRLMENFNFICNCQACTENWPKRRTDIMLQDMLSNKVTDKTIKLFKLMCEENINLHSLYDFDRNYCSEKILQDNVKVVEMCYQNYGSLLADLMSINFQLNIEEALDGLYGYEYDIPDKC